MKFYGLLLLVLFPPMLIFRFQSDESLADWRIVNDVVMGGRSTADLTWSAEGYAIFSGAVSLENYGGFASVRHRFPSMDVTGYTHAVIRLRGDGKRYQFRVTSAPNDRHTYRTYFETTGAWQTIEIPLADLIPAFRGRQLAIPNYPGKEMSGIAFLIGNKKNETFRLELAELSLR